MVMLRARFPKNLARKVMLAPGAGLAFGPSQPAIWLVIDAKA
jgi:hypothetical protein